MAEVLLEVCPSCGGMMRDGRWMCKACLQSSKVPMVLVSDEPEFKPKRYNRGSKFDDICGHCPKVELCRERVSGGGHCYCEILAEDDLLIMELERDEML